jgi:hypothetical protein
MPLVAAGLTMLLSLPALRAGFVGDDYYHRAMLLGTGEVGEVYNPLTDLFEFVPQGSGADRLRDAGVIPWWSHPELELGFLRPVTALSHMLDYALWPHAPALQHAQSMLWFGIGVVLAGILYRQVHGLTAVAGLAVLLFAVEDAHSMPIGWLANRNASIALVFGLLGAAAHDERRWPRFVAKGLLVLHLPVAAIMLVAWVAFLPEFNLIFEAGARAAPRDPALAEQSLVFVNGQDLPCSYTLLIRQLDGDAPAPRRVVILAPMGTAATATRLDESTLLIETEDGWLDYPFDRLMRGIETPFEAGELIETSIFNAEVIKTSSDGRPLSAVFSFSEPLESESHRWLWWRDGRLVDFELPPVGGRVELRPESLLQAAANVR